MPKRKPRQPPLRATNTDPELISRFEADPTLIERKSVYAAIATCQTEEEACVLIKDLLADKEIDTIEDRWGIAQTILATNCSIRMAADFHGGTRAKISRVAREIIDRKPLGYRLAYKRLSGTPRDEEVDNA